MTGRDEEGGKHEPTLLITKELQVCECSEPEASAAEHRLINIAGRIRAAPRWSRRTLTASETWRSNRIHERCPVAVFLVRRTVRAQFNQY